MIIRAIARMRIRYRRNKFVPMWMDPDVVDRSGNFKSSNDLILKDEGDGVE